MDSVPRLIVGFVLSCVCALSFAIGSVAPSSTPSQQPSGWDDGRTPARYESADAFMAAFIAYVNASHPSGFPGTFTSGGSSGTSVYSVGAACSGGASYNLKVCPYKRTDTITAGSSIGTSVVYNFNGSSAAACLSTQSGALTNTGGAATCMTPTSCPANSVPSAGSCTCDVGFKPSGGSCVPTSCPSGPGPQYVTVGTSAAPYLCQADEGAANYGCTMESGSGIGTTDASGTKTYYQSTRYTGGACQGTGDGSGAGVPAPAEVPPHEETNAEKCAYSTPPLCPGTVNGQSVCIKCASSTTTDKEVSEAPAGAGSAPSGLTPGTKTTTTECSGSTCTTTTTTKNSSGAIIGTTTTTGPGTGAGGGGGGDSAFGGSCAAGAAAITCEGDAVQCSIAREQFRRQCEFFEKTTDESAVAGAAKTAGIAGDTDHPNRNPESVSLGSFDQTDLVGGSCPADRTLGSGAAVVTIPFSQLCGPASTLGLILVGITALGCVAIVFKG